MSPVIKAYIYIPIPVRVSEKPIKKGQLEWQNHKPVPLQLSVLLYRWMSQRHFPYTLWN
jgi:hypothetical protein